MWIVAWIMSKKVDWQLIMGSFSSFQNVVKLNSHWSSEIALRSQSASITYIKLPYQHENKSNKQKLRTFNSYCIICVQHVLYVTQSLTTFNKRWISWSVTFNSAVTSTVLAGSSCLDISRTPLKQFSLIYPLFMLSADLIEFCWITC